MNSLETQWTPVFDGLEGFNQYVDMGSVHRYPNWVEMWDLIDYNSVQVFRGKNVLSVKSRWAFDVEKKKARLIESVYYSGLLGCGDVCFHGDEIYLWSPIEPGSVVEAMWEMACGKR